MPDLPERLPIAQAPISAILLAYNAAAELEEVVAAWDAYLASLSRPYEMIVVDDGSTDETRDRLGLMAGGIPHLRVLAQEQHAGVGAALRTALREARHP